MDICRKEGYFYLLFEHKSYPAKGIAFQLLRYMVEIWEAKRNKEQAKVLPIIIPLVIYHGQQSWQIPSSLGELLNGYDKLPDPLKVHVPNFEFLLFDVSRFSDEEIKGTAHLKGSEVVMTLAEILRQEGLEIGGVKALSEVAILQLTSKFGVLPKEMKNAISKADKDTLQVILMNIFNLQNIDEVKKYIH